MCKFGRGRASWRSTLRKYKITINAKVFVVKLLGISRWKVACAFLEKCYV